MPVITISRGVCSGGETLAESIAARLGCRCLSRDELVERAAVDGVGESELRDALQKSPGLLDWLRSKRLLYLALIRAALAEEAIDGNLVYHGNAGHLLLQGAAPVLRVRIVAPLEVRQSIAQERLRLDREESAAFIAHSDAERREWTRFLYDVEWSDPSLYDLVLNLKHAGADDACEVVGSMAGLSCFVWTPERRSLMRDFAVASRVRASLGMDRRTAPLELAVSCRSGIVSVRGFVGSQTGIREVERVASQVPGIRELDIDELVVYHDV